LQFEARLDHRGKSYLGSFKTAHEAARHRHAAICALPEGERATYKQDFVPRPDDPDGTALPPVDPMAGNQRRVAPRKAASSASVSSVDDKEDEADDADASEAASVDPPDSITFYGVAYRKSNRKVRPDLL
jgi:hypothetical protein